MVIGDREMNTEGLRWNERGLLDLLELLGGQRGKLGKNTVMDEIQEARKERRGKERRWKNTREHLPSLFPYASRSKLLLLP